LYRAIRKTVKSSSFVVDPAVENSAYKLANYSTKKYATTHGRRRGVLKDFMDCRGLRYFRSGLVRFLKMVGEFIRF
jgi:hypothetical protein